LLKKVFNNSSNSNSSNSSNTNNSSNINSSMNIVLDNNGNSSLWTIRYSFRMLIKWGKPKEGEVVKNMDKQKPRN